MEKFPVTAAFYTLGCRLNQAETALLCGRLEEQGCRIVELGSGEDIDLIIINTCTVTGNAARKSRQIARKLKKNHPAACLLVTGCSAEIEHSFWAEEPWVDLLLPNPAKRDIVRYLREWHKEQRCVSYSFSPQQERDELFYEQAEARFPFKSRAFLKIQEGCNNFCTYCIVPYARGRERSRARRELLEDFRQLLAAGFQEIVLAGVNVSSYNDHGCRLPDLLAELCCEPGNYRIRLSSTEPQLDNMQLLEVMADNDKICRFLHLSLQHGSDTVLRRMNRKYTTAQFAAFMAAARKAVPGIHLGTDVIVGFPGENEELFSESVQFIRRMAFANVHLFRYSPREGTPAATYPEQVPAAVARERYEYLEKIVAQSQRDFIDSQLQCELAVIFERRSSSGIYEGWSDNYIACASDSRNIVEHLITRVESEKVLPDGRLWCRVKDN